MRTIAFYLPQFHSIPENDEWWGEGFTEWVNVRRATPQYYGHRHPRRSTLLGEYDLTDKDVLHVQSELARSYGVDGFCIYFYWFDGRRLLEKPLEDWRSNAALLPYCLSWANESWTRRWDGKDHEVLMPQSYKRGFVDDLADSLIPHFGAAHYLRMGDAPILVVHRADQIPQPDSMARTLRERAREAGFSSLYLVAAETKPGIRPGLLDFDAIVEFPPVGANTLSTAQLRPVQGLSSEFRGRLMSYDRLVERYSSRPDVEFVRHRCVAPGWDNTARRQAKATIYHGSTPAKYGRWLAEARAKEEAERGRDGLVFINAWNEWAEGAYLEPDELYGLQYLEATRPTSAQILDNVPLTRGTLRLSYPHIRSMVLNMGGSALSRMREIRNRGL